MSARILIHCDAVHTDRTPPECRAFLTVNNGLSALSGVAEYTAAAGWTQDDGHDRCPSSSRGVA